MMNTAKKNLKNVNLVAFGYMALTILFIILTIFATTNGQNLIWSFTSIFCAMYFMVRMFFSFDNVIKAKTLVEMIHYTK